MKIRQGFVSNSSSSSFIIAFDNIDNLFNHINHWDQYFALWEPYDLNKTIDSNDVIHEIKKLKFMEINTHEDYEKYRDDRQGKIPYFKNIDVVLSRLENLLEYHREEEDDISDALDEYKRIGESVSSKSRYDLEMDLFECENYIDSFNMFINNIIKIKKFGCKEMCIIEFGDNEGDIYGNKVGVNVMCNAINLYKPNFCMFREDDVNLS